MTTTPTLSMTDVAFDKAENVTSIRYRLAPIDVGFDLRKEGMPIVVEFEPVLRVSYANKKGQRRVVSGPFKDVVARLRKMGYLVRREEPRS